MIFRGAVLSFLARWSSLLMVFFFFARLFGSLFFWGPRPHGSFRDALRPNALPIGRATHSGVSFGDSMNFRFAFFLLLSKSFFFFVPPGFSIF